MFDSESLTSRERKYTFFLQKNNRIEETIFIEKPSMQENAKHIAALQQLLQTLPVSFGETLYVHMKRKHYTDMRLANASLLSSKMVHEYRTKPYSNIKIGTTVALCVGLHLHPLLSYDLIEKTANRFVPTLEHTAYQLILQTMTDKTIYECNDFLNSLGIAPLTGKTS